MIKHKNLRNTLYWVSGISVFVIPAYLVSKGQIVSFILFLLLLVLVSVILKIILRSNINYLHNTNNISSHPISKPFKSTPQQWAKEILTFPNSNYVILDCETTGLGPNDEIIQLAIIDMQGNTLFDSLIKTSPGKRISPQAQLIHGITKEKLKDAPTFPEIITTVFRIINNKNVITYNAEYDRRMLMQTINKYPKADVGEITYLTARFDCAMKAYAAHIGERSNFKDDYKWQKLPGGDHSALGDCLATLKIIKVMAAYA